MTLSLNASQTALVLIDLQRAVVERDLAPHKASDVVERGARLAAAMRKAGGMVVYVHVLVSEIVRLPADKAVPPPPQGPGDSDLVPAAGYQPGVDLLVAKRQWGAFYATNLDQALRRRGIKKIVLCGVATNFGVESTARAAQEHGYALVFAEDAMSGRTKEWHEFATREIFPVMGHVRSTEEILAALG